MEQTIRVRFAPSPTGGLHLGGVRTVLYNYLFARAHKGAFVLRIEDTDQSRFVPGAEDYILNCLKWCGLEPDESPVHGGPFGPYRQSERKPLYNQYALQLVAAGQAYYAFDTPEELEDMRNRLRSEENPSPQYDRTTRMQMRNSLSMPEAEVQELLTSGTPYVIRIKMPEDQKVTFTDIIRGEISFDTATIDDKVLLKRDGMPTYHLAVVVDDYLMQITHAFRGEEWLPSAPVHILLWEYLGWEDRMPQWAHLPLILGPDGSKLSKRHGNKYGFPIFAMNWSDPNTGDFTEGFRERGFLPEAFTNLLAMLGWNDGTGQELFSMEELIERFDLSRVNHSGAVFDFEKARWFNHKHIQQTADERLAELALPYLQAEGIEPDAAKLLAVVPLIKERCYLLPDFVEHGHYFFRAPQTIDFAGVSEKWNESKHNFFTTWAQEAANLPEWTATALEAQFNEIAARMGLKKGEVMLPLRVMLVGGKFGPGVFDIAAMLGAEETTSRIEKALQLLKAQ
jgi:glutamyl-tRNA synthetase